MSKISKIDTLDALGDTITTILTTNINTNDDNDKHNDYDDNFDDNDEEKDEGDDDDVVCGMVPRWGAPRSSPLTLIGHTAAT